jgi:hypothetical protein
MPTGSIPIHAWKSRAVLVSIETTFAGCSGRIGRFPHLVVMVFQS